MAATPITVMSISRMSASIKVNPPSLFTGAIIVRNDFCRHLSLPESDHIANLFNGNLPHVSQCNIKLKQLSHAAIFNSSSTIKDKVSPINVFNLDFRPDVLFLSVNRVSRPSQDADFNQSNLGLFGWNQGSIERSMNQRHRQHPYPTRMQTEVLLCFRQVPAHFVPVCLMCCYSCMLR